MELNTGSVVGNRTADGLLAWPEFRAELEEVSLTWVDGPRDQAASWVRDSEFGGLRIRKIGSHHLALRAERSHAHIDAYRDELIWLCLVLVGEFDVSQSDESVRLNVGDMVFVDACQPFRLAVSTGPIDTLWIGSRRSLIANHIWDIDELLGTRINGQIGAGRVASSVIQAAFHEIEPVYTEGNRIVHGLFGVLGAATENLRLEAGGSRIHNAVVRRIKRYIDANLGDETMTVRRIAEVQGFSTRYLAKIFQTEKQTVSAWIWNRRLERSHVALQNAERNETISKIAYDHGFKNVSHFSRAFQHRFGKTASEVLHNVA